MIEVLKTYEGRTIPMGRQHIGGQTRLWSTGSSTNVYESDREPGLVALIQQTESFSQVFK